MNNTLTRAAAAVMVLTGLFAGAAQAQSSVTFFGTVDIGLTRVSGAEGKRTGLSHSNANVSRFGFRGVEDLGNGLKAGFWLEAGMAPDEGTTTAAFNRRATVSLMGEWGELRMGRDDSVTFLNSLFFDPFMTNGVGGTNTFLMNGAPTIQLSNTVSYFLPPNLGGFYGQVQHAFSERLNTDPTVAGEYSGLRLGYRKGPLHAAVAVAKMQGLTQAQDQRFRNAGVSYDFGIAQPMLLWASEKRGDVEVRGLQLGVKVPIGAGEVRASLGRYNAPGAHADWRKFAVGYAHNLSKRTQVYASYARVNNDRESMRSISAQGLGAAPNRLGGHSTGYELGIRHFF